MTERVQSVKYRDYFHALATRVLCENRLLQPRRAGFFETEFAGPSDIDDAALLASEPEPAAASMASAFTPDHGSVVSVSAGVPNSAQSYSAPVNPTPPSSIENRRPSAATAPHVEASAPQPPPAATTRSPAAPQPAENEIRILDREIHSPALFRPALLPAEELRTSVPVPPGPPNRPVTDLPEVFPVAATHERPGVTSRGQSMTERRLRPSSHTESRSGVLIAHALPEMRNLASFFPAQAAKESPTVEITIGRIELRAVAARTSGAPSRPVASSPRNTLQEYLSRNTGGRA